jgi:hypothetical protein
MGVMTKRSPEGRRTFAKWAAAATAGLFLWSFVAAPSGQTADEEIAEPLSAYDASADAAPIRGLVAHKTYLVEAEPGIARSTSEVSLPSTATSTSWLADFGLVNGLHGTTTGNKVPTEATATMPGGPEREEFSIANPTIGNGALMSFGAAVSRASATSGERPRGFGHGYLANLNLLPAPGTAEAPPGSYDPEADKQKETEHAKPSPGSSAVPDDPQAFTPNPRGQMAILSIGSVASTADTFREDNKVISIAVAELNGINLGNRTADGRCTNCITIDSMRVEARAESDGTPAGALAEWRVLIHRACRVAITNDAATGQAYEGVQCLDPNPDMLIEAFDKRDPAEGEHAIADPNARGVRKIDTAELNKQFAALAAGLGISDLGLTLEIGTSPDNSRTVDKVTGEEAIAVARGLVLELRTTGTSDFILERIAGNDSFKTLISGADAQCQTIADTEKPGPLASPPPQLGAVAVPPQCGSAVVDTATTVRTLRLALGSVKAVAKASALTGGIGGGDGDPGPQFPSITIPSIQIPSFNIPPGGGSNTTIVQGGGIQAGPLKLKLNWSSVRLKPWKAKDMAKGFFTGGMVAGIVALMRRRLLGV